jgi:hypothetical protein
MITCIEAMPRSPDCSSGHRRHASVHLLVSVKLTDGARLWMRDKRLRAVAHL